MIYPHVDSRHVKQETIQKLMVMSRNLKSLYTYQKLTASADLRFLQVNL